MLHDKPCHTTLRTRVVHNIKEFKLSYINDSLISASDSGVAIANAIEALIPFDASLVQLALRHLLSQEFFLSLGTAK